MPNYAIAHWPIEERPRERLLMSGPESLSDAELLAVLLRSGTRGKDALMLAREILTFAGSLRQLFSLDPKRLEGIQGLGNAKIATLIAARELCSRRLREQILRKNIIQDPQGVMEYFYASMSDRKKEVFKVLFLDKGNKVLDEKNLFEGTVDQTAVHPREVVQAALDRHASALVLIHNHPSGRTEPSQDDRILTGKLQGACSPLGIKILDHLIIGDHQFFSFKEHRLL